jgi:uncharacterized protein YbjT (DUF2867 family)
MMPEGREQPDHPLILITGATGYIGGRLVPRLLELGCRVRCLVRDPDRLQGRPWANDIEIARGNVLQPETLPQVLKGVRTAYYLVHSMGSGADFFERDLEAARSFGKAAREAGVEHIIYLGGLCLEGPGLSEHLRSRHQTGDALRASGVLVTEFRAGVIVGSGSVSFEMIRYLTERVPIMILPRWVGTRTQPIGVREVLAYLTGALSVPESRGAIIEIGGSQVMTYREMMTQYAEVRGLRRVMLPVPVLTPTLSAHWVSLVTPIHSVIARPLIEGLRTESIVHDDTALRLFPDIKPVDYRTSVERALVRLDASNVETTWSDALSTSHGLFPPVILTTHEGMILEYRQQMVDAPAEDVYRVFSGIGGGRGWFYWNWTWELRGLIDRMVGGVGLRRGRRDPDEVRVGDALDFWRVEAVEPGHLLRLRAEMKVPGNAWLQFKVNPRENGKVLLVQTAFFAPRGLWGLLYWYALYPLHSLIFSGLIREVARRAEGLTQRHSKVSRKDAERTGI